MSKAPKTKRTTFHYQPYQAFGPNGEEKEQSMDPNLPDLPSLNADPVLLGLSSNMSRNLWDDWNENDANFGMKFDMYTDEASTTSPVTSTSRANLMMPVHTRETPSDYEEPDNVLLNTMTHPLHALEGVTASTLENQQKSRANVQRSLSEDIVNMLDDSNDTMFSKPFDIDQRSNVAMENMTFNPGQNMMGFQHHMQQFQQQQMQMKMELQLQQQQQHEQQTAALNSSSWMNNFGGGTQFSATTNTSASGKPSNPSAHRRQSHPPSSIEFDAAFAEGAVSLTAQCPASQVPATPATSSSRVPTTAQQASNVNRASENFGSARTQTGTPSACVTTSEDASVTNTTTNTDTDPSSNSNASLYGPSQQANAFGAQGMMMNPFMMYSMMVPQAMNMMGIPMQIPLGTNMNSTNEMSRLPLPMQMQLQLQMQMQMAQMAQMNGMGGMNGMQMPIGFPGMSMGMPMQMSLNMNMQQQQRRVHPQSELSSDIDMAPAFSMAMSAPGGPMLKTARALQPKGVHGGPGFVNIARKPEEPEVSSILKSLMDEEAKKKEKKLERNRDSARESRRKQQTYVETLENGIKRLQINRDLIRSYRWGVSGPGFSPLPCANSLELSDWKNRVAVVTGRTEAFSNIQNPANFQSLMRLNRQRRTLAIHYQERERAVWKCFMCIGRQLAAMRTRVLQVQMLRTFSENPLAMELDTLLNLTADQKLQLQCHAQQMFNEEVVELTKLFKIFYALRNEALRLNSLCPSLERHFREACSFEQLQRLLQWTENHRAVIETDLCLDEV